MARTKDSDHPLALALELHGFTQTELARFAECSTTLVSLVIHGHKRPSARFRRASSRLLHLPEERLFPGLDDDDQTADVSPTSNGRRSNDDGAPARA